MLKKALLLASTIATISCSAYGAKNNPSTPEVSYNDTGLYCGGYTLGLTLSNEDGNVGDFLTFGYFDDWFLANLGINFVHFHIPGFHSKANIFSFLGQLGLRNQLHNNLYVSYGVSTTIGTKRHPKLQYSVGAFVGLDFQISRHFLLSGKIDAFNYAHHRTGIKFYQVFQAGSINLAYVF